METATYGDHTLSQTSPIDSKLFRAVCGHFVTGVTVVTTTAPDLQPVGLTINSFTSVSLAPPLVLFCLDLRSGVREVLRHSRYFAVNILAEDQENISRAFATRAGPRFADMRTHPARTGAPIIDDSLAYLDCRYVNEVDGGDHAIVLGEVVDLGVQRQDGNPLAFFRSTHAQLGPPR